ncbi:MAG: hypothetical protein KatS3mg060_1371 [Dehalococcoidia bacterium]|nr:MAG: hypothetical protein KatS3mg060_1371 [Dehalococcoidia bacterium]
MKIGLFNGVSVFPGEDHRSVVERLVEQVRFADSAGFWAQWIAERHFTPFTASGAPSVLLGHLAAHTTRLRLGYAVALLSLYHPVRFAEEVAWVDTLSGGRTLVALGPGGSPQEYDAFGVPPTERRERFEEAFQIVRAALEGERFEWRGRFWTIPPIQIYPQPTRGRTFWLACSSAEHVVWAASLDAIPLLGQRSNDEVRHQLAVYREARAALGDDAATIDGKVRQVGVIRRVMLGRSQAEADDHVAQSQAAFQAAWRHVTGLAADADLPPPRYERADVIAGEAETVVHGLTELALTGVGHVVLAIGAGGLGVSNEVLRFNLETLAERVLPAVEAVAMA